MVIIFSLNPKDFKSYYNLAWVQTWIKEYDDAIENYKKAINISPNYSPAQFKLSLIYLAREKFSEGWQYYESRTRIKEADIYQKKILDLNYDVITKRNSVTSRKICRRVER